MNILEEYRANEIRNSEINNILDRAAFKWISQNVGVWKEGVPTKEQVGRAYIGSLTNRWGYGWRLTEDEDETKVAVYYNVVKNEYLDIDEDVEVVMTFDEFLKYAPAA